MPGIYDGVERSIAVKVRALDEQGESRHRGRGTLAVCIQHQIDDLNGKASSAPVRSAATASKAKPVKAEREARR